MIPRYKEIIAFYGDSAVEGKNTKLREVVDGFFFSDLPPNIYNLLVKLFPCA